MGDIADYELERRESSLYKKNRPMYYELDFTWGTRDGQKLRPENMETSHIKNILKCKNLACGQLPRNVKRIFLGELALRGENETA